MDIIKSFERAYTRMKEKNWDNIYILVDVHDTIIKGSYKDEEKHNFFPYSIEALYELSSDPRNKLILWTSSYVDKIEKFRDLMIQYGIIFDYVNYSPEPNTDFQCLDSKIYFNVGIDDKFGFEPETDWQLIYEYYENQRS